MSAGEEPSSSPAGSSAAVALPAAADSTSERTARAQQPIEYRRYRAPRVHGQVLADPPLADVPRLAAQNRERLAEPSQQLWGVPADAWRQEARRELLELASTYTRAYRDWHIPDVPAVGTRYLVLTGHQPRLYHPGVWFKNFALDRIGKSLSAVAINLIVDNDLVGPAAIRVPTGSVTEPRLESVPYDRSAGDMPFEERTICDPAMFAGFGQHAADCLRPLVSDPIVTSWWPVAVEESRAGANLGLVLARARHRLEGQWGTQTGEVPLSHVCDTVSFRRFLLRLWYDLPGLVAVHNAALDEYRRVHRIRSRSHPVPALESDGDWWEAPCWIWTRTDPKRRRLFVRSTASGCEITDRHALRRGLPAGALGDGAALERLAELAREGIRIRPRALLTTLYARLLLGDLFIHGIGGGKYDQLTDALVRRYFGWEPPNFLVLSATAELPIERPRVDATELAQFATQLRDLRFNPDRHVAVSPETRPWIEAKRAALAMQPPPASLRQRHTAIERANAALQQAVTPLRERLQAQRDQLATRTRHDRLLASREFAFCLFPATTLQALLLDKWENDYKLNADPAG
ncbi:MAG: hypothetical protein AB7F89_10460 [Pirellulaceae bacterium]